MYCLGESCWGKYLASGRGCINGESVDNRTGGVLSQVTVSCVMLRT